MRISDWSSDVCSSDLLDQTHFPAITRGGVSQIHCRQYDRHREFDLAPAYRSQSAEGIERLFPCPGHGGSNWHTDGCQSCHAWPVRPDYRILSSTPAAGLSAFGHPMVLHWRIPQDLFDLFVHFPAYCFCRLFPPSRKKRVEGKSVS